MRLVRSNTSGARMRTGRAHPCVEASAGPLSTHVEALRCRALIAA